MCVHEENGGERDGEGRVRAKRTKYSIPYP